MKTTALFIAIALLSCTTPKKEEPVEVAFTIPDKNLVLEGMAYDPVQHNFYFGTFNKRKVLRVSESGEVSDFITEAQDGVSAVAGIFVDVARRELLFCGSDEGADGKSTLFRYEIETGKLINKYRDETGQAQMFNDLVRLTDGTIYLTDSFQPAIYKLQPDSDKLVRLTNSEIIRHANGITATPDDKFVFVSTSKSFARIETSTDSIVRVSLPNYDISGNDGLYYYKNSLIGVQNVSYPPFVGRYFLNDSLNSLVKGQVLAVDHPLFNIPATGAIANGKFYFMANTHLANFDYEKRVMLRPEELREISILRVALDPAEN